MSHHCPFPVRSTDNRCGYHASNVPGMSLCLALAIALTCFAGLSYAGDVSSAQETQLAAEIGVTLPSIHISVSR